MSSPTDQSPPKAAVSGTTPGSRRLTSRRATLLVVGGCLLIWFWRRPEQLLRPYVWDEESVVIRRFLDDGWLGALRPVQGYLILPSTLLLPLAAAISFAHLPVLAYWMATTVFALTVWMLVVPDSRWGTKATRVLMAFAMALCPTNPETFGVLLYSFWWATLWPVIILGWKRDLWWARGPLLIIAGLSSPAGAIMAVPFAVSYWVTRRRADLVTAGVLSVALALQITLLLAGDRMGGVASTGMASVVAQSVRTGGLFFAWWTAPAQLYWWIGPLAGLLAFGALAVVAVYALRQRQAVEPLLLLVAVSLFTGLSAAPVPLLTNPQDAGPRYYFLPFVLLSWLLVNLWRESLLPSPVSVAAVVLLAVSLLGIMTTFSRSPASTSGRLDWEQEIVDCSASTARMVKIPVYYDGSAESLWSMNMTPVECRVVLGRPTQ